MKTSEITYRAAGCIILSTITNRICLCKRSEFMRYPGTWSTWGGNMDPDETPKQTVYREVLEETGFSGIDKLTPLLVYRDDHNSFVYHNFLAIINHEFTPMLDLYESEAHMWVDWGQWPKPLHPGLARLLGDKNSVSTILRYMR